jgi:hypothetical protein
VRWIDQASALVRMRFRQQFLHGHLGEARIAKPAVAVVVGDLLRLHQQVHVIGPEEVALAELERLKEVEHFEHGEALRRRRRLADRDAAIRAADRLAPVRLLGGQVRFGEEAA